MMPSRQQAWLQISPQTGVFGRGASAEGLALSFFAAFLEETVERLHVGAIKPRSPAIRAVFAYYLAQVSQLGKAWFPAPRRPTL